MTTKHTLGPWEVGATFPHCVFAPDGKVVANATGQRGDIKATANARLIAAAPELLEALQGMLESVGETQMDGYVENSLHSEDVAKARAAIAKATSQ